MSAHFSSIARFCGSLARLREIVDDQGLQGTWTFEHAYHQFQYRHDLTCFRWWPDTGQICWLISAFDLRKREKHPEAAKPEMSNRWPVTKYLYNHPALTLPELYFTNPLCFRIFAGIETRHGKQSRRLLALSRLIKIPERFGSDAVVLHSFKADGAYGGFEIMPQCALVHRKQGCFIFDDRIDLRLFEQDASRKLLPTGKPFATSVETDDDEDDGSVDGEAVLFDDDNVNDFVETAIPLIISLFADEMVWDRKRYTAFFSDPDNFINLT